MRIRSCRGALDLVMATPVAAWAGVFQAEIGNRAPLQALILKGAASMPE